MKPGGLCSPSDGSSMPSGEAVGAVPALRPPPPDGRGQFPGASPAPRDGRACLTPDPYEHGHAARPPGGHANGLLPCLSNGVYDPPYAPGKGLGVPRHILSPPQSEDGDDEGPGAARPGAPSRPAGPGASSSGGAPASPRGSKRPRGRRRISLEEMVAKLHNRTEAHRPGANALRDFSRPGDPSRASEGVAKPPGGRRGLPDACDNNNAAGVDDAHPSGASSIRDVGFRSDACCGQGTDVDVAAPPPPTGPPDRDASRTGGSSVAGTPEEGRDVAGEDESDIEVLFERGASCKRSYGVEERASIRVGGARGRAGPRGGEEGGAGRYLEPISDEENSLLCAPSPSSGLSSVSGFQSSSDTPMFSDAPSDASRGTLMARISDAVAALLSDVSDGSLPASPPGSDSDDPLQGEGLSRRIDGICERLRRECPPEAGGCGGPWSDARPEGVLRGDPSKERTASRVDEDASGDVAHPEVGFAQRRTDLGLHFRALSPATQPAREASPGSDREPPSSIAPGETAGERRRGSAKRRQAAPELDEPGKPEGREGRNCVNSAPGSLCAITTPKQSSSNLALLPDTHVNLSSHTQAPIDGVGTDTVVCSSTLNAGINLCQNHISGSQTISSQIQNCNTSPMKSEDKAAGLPIGMPDTITLDDPVKSKGSPEPGTDDALHERIPGHFEVHPPDEASAGEESSPRPASEASRSKPSSRDEGSPSLMPHLGSEKDKRVPRDSNESVAEEIDNVYRPLQAKSGESHQSTDTCNFTLAKDHAILGSTIEEIALQSCQEPDIKNMSISSDLSAEKIAVGSHSFRETGLVSLGFPEKSSLEHIQSSSGHAIVHSSVLMDYSVKPPLEDQLKNCPEVEDSPLKRTNHSPQTRAAVAPQKMGSKDLLTFGAPNEESGLAFGNMDDHGQRIRSLLALRVVSNDSTSEISSIPSCDKLDTSSSGDYLNKRESAEEIGCVGKSLPVETTKDNGSFPNLIEKNEPLGDQNCSPAGLNLRDGTSSDETCATLPDCCTGSVVDSVSSEVPAFEEKSSLPESGTTENSAVNTYPLSTVVHLSKHESIDRTSYQNPSEVEWSADALHSRVFVATSNSLSAHRGTSLDGAPSDVTRPSHNVSPSDSDAANRDGTELSHVCEVTPKDIRPPIARPERTDHEATASTAPEKHSVHSFQVLFPDQDEDTQLGRHPAKDTPPEIGHQAANDSDAIHRQLNVAAVDQQTDGIPEVFHFMKNAEGRHQQDEMTEVNLSPELSARVCHSATVAFDTHLHPTAQATKDMHSVTSAADVTNPLTYITEDLPTQATEVSCTPTVGATVSHSQAAEVCLPRATVSARVSYPPTEASLSNLPLGEGNEASHSLAVASASYSSASSTEFSSVHPIAAGDSCAQVTHSDERRLSVTVDNDNSHPIAAVSEVGFQRAVCADALQSANTEVHLQTCSDGDRSHQTALTESSAHTAASGHSPTKTSEVNRQPVNAANKVPEIDELNHSSTDITEEAQQPTNATRGSSLPNTHINLSPPIAIEAGHLPSASSGILSQAADFEDCQVSTVTPEVSHPPAASVKVSQSSTDNTKVDHLHTVAPEVNQRQTLITGIIHPASKSKVGHLLEAIPESLPLTNHTPELLSPPFITTEGSHTYLDTMAHVRQSAASTTMQVSCPVPDITPEISRLIGGVAGKVSCERFQDATKDLERPVQGAKDTEALSWRSGRAFQPHEVSLSNYLPEGPMETSLPDQTIPLVNPMQGECLKNNPIESTQEINHSVKSPGDICHLPADSAVEVSLSPSEATNEGETNRKVSHPLAEFPADANHRLPGYTSEVTTPLSEVNHSVETDAEISHIVSEAMNFPVVSTHRTSPQPEIRNDISHVPTQSNFDVNHCSMGGASEDSYPPFETNPEGNYLTLDSNTETRQHSCPVDVGSYTPVSNIGYQLGEVANKAGNSLYEALHEVYQSTGVTVPDVSHAPIEATTGSSQLSAEAHSETSYPSVGHSNEFIVRAEAAAEARSPQGEGKAEISHSAGETKTEAPAELSQAQDEAEGVPLLYSFPTHCQLTTDNATASVVSSCEASHLDNRRQHAVLENQIETNTTENTQKSGFDHCSTVYNIKDSPGVESGSTRHCGTEDGKDATTIQAIDEELTAVKEEVQQASVGSATPLDGVLPSDIGLGVQADRANLLPSSDEDRGEQMQTGVLENRNDEGKSDDKELEVLGSPCPICFEELDVPLETHLHANHICNAFVPAKASREYQRHMLRRTQDVAEMPEPGDALPRTNFYVCRSCHFASSDINAVRFHLNTHEDVYQVRAGGDACACNRREYSYPFHKWKALLHNSSYHCVECNFYFACERGFRHHLTALHYARDVCRLCRTRVPRESVVSHLSSHWEEGGSSPPQAGGGGGGGDDPPPSQGACVVTRSSGGNYGVSWNIYDNCLNFLDGKDFRLSTSSKVPDANLDRNYLKLPLRNVVDEALVPEEAKIDPGKDITKYMKGKKTIRLSLGDGNDEVLKNFSLSVQMDLQRRMSKKGGRSRGQSGGVSRAKREDDLFDVLGISSSRSRGAPKREAQEPPAGQQGRASRGRPDEEGKAGAGRAEPPHLTRTRSGMQPGRSGHEEKAEKPEALGATVEIEGEWSKEHTYICCSCGAGYLNLADIMDHKWEMHPSVWCAHTMIQGQGSVPSSFCRQYQPPTSQPHRLILPSMTTEELQSGVSKVNPEADTPEVERKDLKTCTSCNAQFEDITVFHTHLVECGGLSLYSSMKKKNRKGYRFKRRKGQGVPNNRYGNSSHPSTPLKVKTGDRSSGLNTPQNDRFTTAGVHSSGVKRRLELAVGSIDNLELKNRLKAIITGSRGKGGGAFGLPGRRTVRMKLRKKALETRRLRKTRHSDRVKEIVRKDQEKREERKVISKNEKEDKSEVQDAQKSEEAQITKKSGIKKGSVAKQEDPKSRERFKKKVSKVSGVNAEGNVETEVSKPFIVPTSESFDVSSVSKEVTDNSKLEETYHEGSQVEKKLETDKRINGVIEKGKKTKKRNGNGDNDTKSLKKNSGMKVKLPADKKTSSKAIKNALVTKITEVTVPVEQQEYMVHPDNVYSKLNIVEKVGTKMKQVLSKNMRLIDSSRKKAKRPRKNDNRKKKLVESELVHDPSKAFEGVKRIKPKKAKESDDPGLDARLTDYERNQLNLQKSSSFDQFSSHEVDPENLIAYTDLVKEPATSREASDEMEARETARARRAAYYSSSDSDDSDDSDYSEPEVVRNFRIGRRCGGGGRTGLRNKRKPANARYSFRTCFSSAEREDESESEGVVPEAKRVDYQEKEEEEEFSEELPVTSKRKRKVANYENQDDYTYVPHESSTDVEDEISENELIDLDIIPWSARKRRKILTRSRYRDPISLPVGDAPIQNENGPEDKQEMAGVPADASVEVDNPVTEAPIATTLDTTESEVAIPKRKVIKKAMTSSHNSEASLDDEGGLSEVKMPKTKRKMNIGSSKLSLKGKLEKEAKKPKRRKNAKLFNMCSDTLDIKDHEILTKAPKKKKKVVLPENLSSNNVFQEEIQDDVESYQKTNNLNEILPDNSIIGIETAASVTVGTPQIQNVRFQNTVTESLWEETKLIPEKAAKKKKRGKLQSNSCDNLESNEAHPVIRKAQRKKKLKLQDIGDTPHNHVLQDVAVVVTKKKNAKAINSLPNVGDLSRPDAEGVLGKAERKRTKSKEKLNNALLYAQEEHIGGLPSTAKRRKKVRKKSDSIDQDVCHSEMFSSHVLAEDEEDNIPLSTLANLNIKMKKEKLIFNSLKTKKDALKECGALKHKKSFGKVKKSVPVKNLDLFIKEAVTLDSESSSFEGFAPMPFKKADGSRTAIKKPRKRLGRVKSLNEMNASSTASESELSDVPKQHQKPKNLTVFSYDETGAEDIGMPNLSTFSKIKRDQENYPFHHQTSAKIQTSQKRVRARPRLKPALQENLDGAEGKTKVLKSSKKRNNAFVPHTMPVLEPMNIFQPDIGMASDQPESDSNGEGVPSLAQKHPSKTKRRRPSVEKIKDIPTRSSIQQMTENQSPPELKAVSDEPRWEGSDGSPLTMEHQMPLLKTETLKPPQQRKRRTKSSQEVVLKGKPDVVLSPLPEKDDASEVINRVKEPVTNVSQKKSVKRKRAASISGVPSRDVQELVSSVNKVIAQPLAHLSVAPKKNSESAKRKKTGGRSKEDVNELKCVDCGLKFGSVASLEDHQQDCLTIAFEMSLMEAEDHLFECPHCHLTFALKGTQRKHTASCRLVKYKRTASRQQQEGGGRSLKRGKSAAATSLAAKLSGVVDSPLGDPSKDHQSKENVADNRRASPLRDAPPQVVPSFTNHGSGEGRLQDYAKKVEHLQRVGVVPLAAIGSPRTKKSSQVNGKVVNSDILDLISPANVEDSSSKCSTCGVEVTDRDASHRHQLLKRFAHYCQQQTVLEVCVLLTHYNLGLDAVRSLVSSGVARQGSTVLGLDARQQVAPFVAASDASGGGSARKLQDVLASPHCAWVTSVLETVAGRHLASEAVSVSGTRQDALRAVSTLEEILREISEVDGAIRKNHMLKSMRETFEAGTLN